MVVRGNGTLFLLMAWIVFPAHGIAQPGPPAATGSRGVFYEAFAHATPDSGLARVTIQYRIDQEFFMAQRQATDGVRGEFARRGEVLVELFDRAGGSRSRQLRNVWQPSGNEDAAPGTHRWVEGTASFLLAPDEYGIFFEVTDLHSQNRFLDRARKIDARPVRSERLAISTLTFARLPSSDAGAVEGLNFGGDLHLSQGALLYLEVVGLAPADSAVRLRCEFSQPSRDRGSDSPEPIALDTLMAISRSYLIPPFDSTEVPVYRRSSLPGSSASLLLRIPAEQLLLRTYTLKITVQGGGGEATLERPLRVVWPGMPSSLRNVDYALAALRYVAPVEVLDSLASGSFEERRDNLEGFWREKDPTRRTPYNAFMIQYYQRVDYAAATFGTLRNPDGLTTDRAKIYILYGPPSRTERSLDPAGANRETWYYERSKRTFVFEDPLKNGTYVLKPGQ